MPRRYLALWFPWAPSEWARPGIALREASPLVLVTRTGNALRLAATCPRAAVLGLGPGMPLADARARCPTLETASYDPAADARALQRLARRMRRFTPQVALDPPDGLLLDLTGVAHLFGGEDALVAQAVSAPGLATRHALANHAATARALARYGAQGMTDPHALPVAALELPDAALAGLRRAGLTRLGDLTARPLASIAARFGAEAVRRLRAILGEGDAPLDVIRPRAPVRAEARFAEPIARTDDVLDTIEALLLDCFGQLEARHAGGRRFVAGLERCDGARRQLAVETGRPSRDAALVMRLFAERIESLADPLDPGFGFERIHLAVPRAEPVAAAQPVLGGDAAVEDSLAALVDRLATRLGPGQVLRLAARDSHLPEAAQHFVPATQDPRSVVPALPSSAAPRPLLLFDPPQPVTAIAGVPDGPPLRFRWRGAVHEVRLAEGPERIAAEWWRHPEGHLPGRLRTRDYYRVEDAEGRRFWIFRHGLFQEIAAPRWYLHGLFA
jgi:protein ImuB